MDQPPGLQPENDVPASIDEAADAMPLLPALGASTPSLTSTTPLPQPTSPLPLASPSPLPPTPPSTPEIMEVHTHGHIHEKKKWMEYLFQFVMLFLAVTLSFIVENEREHYVEAKRAKILAIAMVSDLRADSSEATQVGKNCDTIIENINRLSVELGKPRAEQNDSLIHALGLEQIVRFNLFDPQMVSYEQAKTSGSLRYFSQPLVSKMSRYENHKNYVIKMATLYLGYWQNTLSPMVMHERNMRFAIAKKDSVRWSGPIFPADPNAPVFTEIYNNAGFVRGQMMQQRSITKEHLALALALIAALREEYSIE